MLLCVILYDPARGSEGGSVREGVARTRTAKRNMAWHDMA